MWDNNRYQLQLVKELMRSGETYRNMNRTWNQAVQHSKLIKKRVRGHTLAWGGNRAALLAQARRHERRDWFEVFLKAHEINWAPI